MDKLLLIDDPSNALSESFARPPLLQEPWLVERASWTTLDFERCRHRPADVIIASAAHGQSRTVEFLTWLRTHPLGSRTIVTLPSDVNPDFVRHCFSAADDFVLCPIRPEELRYRITRILPGRHEEAAGVRTSLTSEHSLAHLVGSDPAFVREIARIPLAARSGCEVLITGETGTGKELCARAIHHLSRRAELAFVCADCAALPDQLFENEMFGHDRGAFTDAHRSHKGLVALADRGTLFLDEIDSLSLPAQAKLLRLLQDRTYKPLGSERFCRANVRIVAATNKNLEQLVEAGTFRRDLFFRINVLQLHMIPLRERPGDIAALVEHFLDVCCSEAECQRKVISPSALQLLCSLEWPGNVRELYNLIRRAVVFCDGLQILPQHLGSEHEGDADAPDPTTFQSARAQAVTAFERRYLEEMLRRHGGNITRAAAAAGKDRRVFGRMVKRLNIDRTVSSVASSRPTLGHCRPGRAS